MAMMGRSRSACSAIMLGLLVVLLTVQCARAANWGAFAVDDVCVQGQRKWFAQLHNILGDWNAACLNTPATVNGVYFARPTNCVNKGVGGEWGEFYVPDPTCG